MTLQTLQSLFQDYLLEKSETMLTQVIASDTNFAQERLGIYREAYVLRLLEALNKNFPMLAKLAGEEMFAALGRDYIAGYPSASYSIGDFGSRLSEYLSTKNTLWSEMACFEWMLNQAVESADLPLLTRAELIALPQTEWAEMRLQLHPSLQMQNFNWNVPELWQALSIGEQDFSASQYESEKTYLVWRKKLKAYFTPLTAAEADMLNALQLRKTFLEICAVLSEHYAEEEIAPFAINTLIRWIDNELFEGISSA